MDKRILVVGDAMFMREIIRKIPNEGGYQNVSKTQDGEEAMTVFRQIELDLVPLDITIPGKSGLEVLEEMLAKESGTKIVVCSAMGQEMMIQRALVADTVDSIIKPFKAGELMRVVDYHLSS